jgi:predicted 3-demethylubiquinone-9 3-methyltransferase (glyoxalase superfamily)
MTDQQIAQFVAEMERRWRSRTPTLDANYINADLRVGRSEMVTWARDTFGVDFSIVDTVEPALVAAIKRMWRRLKREFPEEW